MRRALALLILLAAVGCNGSSKTQGPPPPTQLQYFQAKEIDPIRLKNALVLFADRTSAIISGTMSDIAAGTTDRSVREQTVLLKIRAIPVAYVFAANPDPRVGFLDMWTFVARLRYHVTDGPGYNQFGDQQQLAIDAARTTEEEFLVLAHRFFPDELIETTTPEIESAAARHPLTTDILVPGASASGGGGAADAVLSVPMSPVRGLEGIGGTPDAIDRFTAVAAVFAQHLDTAPERLRWQLELLALEADSLESVVELRENFDQLASSVDRIATTAETLPADIRAELDEALRGADTRIAALKEVLDKSEVVAAQARATTEALAEAGVAWEATVDSANEFMAAVGQMTGSGDTAAAPGPDAEPFQINDVTLAAEEIRNTTAELRGLLDDFEDGKLDAALAGFDAASRSTIDAAGERTEDLIDRLTYRAILVVSALVVGLVLYRLLAERVIRRPA
ncbi:MAG: hypothetical protein ACYSU7_03935 [Planctomycetota bacterium]|jgi:hypothetical protein